MDSRVQLIVDDAFTYLKNNYILYDVIIADLPDPSNDAIAKLYSKQFFMLAKRSLNNGGIFVTQSGEINYSNLTYNCIKNTVAAVFGHVKGYHALVPSFGNWGFTLASDFDWQKRKPRTIPDKLKSLDEFTLRTSFVFPKDIALVETKISTIDNPVVLNYFLEEFERWKYDFAVN
jgi:spermidine synthase